MRCEASGLGGPKRVLLVLCHAGGVLLGTGTVKAGGAVQAREIVRAALVEVAHELGLQEENQESEGECSKAGGSRHSRDPVTDGNFTRLVSWKR